MYRNRSHESQSHPLVMLAESRIRSHPLVASESLGHESWSHGMDFPFSMDATTTTYKYV